MHLGMQGLHAAVHHFGKARQLANIFHRQTSVAQGLCRAACRHQFDMPRREGMAQFDKAGFIRNRQKGPFDYDVFHVLILNGAIAS